MNSIGRTGLWASFAVAMTAVAACGGSDEDTFSGTGGSTSAGGVTGTGATGAGGVVTTGGTTGAGGVVTTGGTTGAGGSITAGGDTGAGGVVTTGGTTGAGGVVTTGGTTGAGGVVTTGGTTGSGGSVTGLAKFSFFVTSYKAMKRECGSDSGCGGDLTFGETGVGAGLRGADKLCTRIAETSMPGSGAKVWRAFLSARSAGDGGTQVNAADRIGDGPWYDRLERLVAANKADLLQTRPSGADPAIINDLPNEDGVPNHDPDGTGQVDNHDILTGSTTTGTLYGTGMGPTCNDWTSKVGSAGKPRVGHSWPRSTGGGGGGFGGNNMANWMSALDEAGCAPGVNLIEMGPPNPANPTVGSGGGYGGIYCFALTP